MRATLEGAETYRACLPVAGSEILVGQKIREENSKKKYIISESGG